MINVLIYLLILIISYYNYKLLFICNIFLFSSFCLIFFLFIFWSEKAMMKRRFKFAIKCLHELMQIEPNENIVFGSYNFYEGLFFIYLLVTGEIEKNLKYVLDLSDSNKNDLLRYRFVKVCFISHIGY